PAVATPGNRRVVARGQGGRRRRGTALPTRTAIPTPTSPAATTTLPPMTPRAAGGHGIAVGRLGCGSGRAPVFSRPAPTAAAEEGQIVLPAGAVLAGIGLALDRLSPDRDTRCQDQDQGGRQGGGDHPAPRGPPRPRSSVGRDRHPGS